MKDEMIDPTVGVAMNNQRTSVVSFGLSNMNDLCAGLAVLLGAKRRITRGNTRAFNVFY